MARTRTSLLDRLRDLDDSLAWEQFDAIYRPMLRRYAHDRGLTGEQADEIVQECMTAIVERIQRFERQASFRGWLRGLVDHKVADHLRKQRPEKQGLTGDFEREQHREVTPAQMWEREWNRAHLLHCLEVVRSQVAEHTYQAFDLYVVREMPVAEVSRMLGMSANQIYVAKSRVMARIEERWSEIMDGILQQRRVRPPDAPDSPPEQTTDE
jgi:RNA polymerase sigma-70 factor (ECF subfamily)